MQIHQLESDSDLEVNTLEDQIRSERAEQEQREKELKEKKKKQKTDRQLPTCLHPVDSTQRGLEEEPEPEAPHHRVIFCLCQADHGELRAGEAGSRDETIPDAW
ncbi:unnamed protein product [Pleuronectes platessa]|uniref:Uncharacterized protein n=1 Tax=Pleuronectes platessa TaxID=8262 RepID=A0A9N7VCB5_PLEPL|nr:unnamed protein product [Pleuronectes platessa]